LNGVSGLRRRHRKPDLARPLNSLCSGGASTIFGADNAAVTSNTGLYTVQRRHQIAQFRVNTSMFCCGPELVLLTPAVQVPVAVTVCRFSGSKSDGPESGEISGREHAVAKPRFTGKPRMARRHRSGTLPACQCRRLLPPGPSPDSNLPRPVKVPPCSRE